MRIEIDTKEDLHNIRHIMRLLQAISSGVHSSKYDDSLFSESTPSSHSPSPVPETSSSLFNMFDSPSSSSSSDSNLGLPSIFDEKKKDEEKKDFIDSLQVY